MAWYNTVPDLQTESVSPQYWVGVCRFGKLLQTFKAGVPRFCKVYPHNRSQAGWSAKKAPFPHQIKRKTAPNSSNKVSICLQEFPHWIFLFHCRILTSSAKKSVRTPFPRVPAPLHRWSQDICFTIGVRGGGSGVAAASRAWNISGQTLSSGQAVVTQKSWMIKKIFKYSEKFQGNSVFQGKRKLLKNPE